MMPSREADLYKDKIEVSLDGRQIFYLFFGGAVIVGLVFVLGVMVGRRVEARGHVDGVRTTAAVDPLAALDRLEGKGELSFQATLTGTGAPSEVERAIGDLEKARARKPDAKADAKPDAKVEPKVDVKADTKPETKPVTKPDDKVESKPVTRPDDKVEARSDKPKPDAKLAAKAEVKVESKIDAKVDAKVESKIDAKVDGKIEKKSEAKTGELAKLDSKTAPKVDGDVKPETRPEAKKKSDDEVAAAEPPKHRYTLQLSSFQDRQEADAFLSSVKASGYQAYLTEAAVSGKGTFYRVRLGKYGSLEAANDAKSEFEKSSKKTASVMRL